MKAISIRNRKILWFCLVLFCGMAAIIGVYCLSKDPRKTEGSFFEIAGFAPEDVEKVTICYEDSSLDLSEKNQQRLLDSLTATQGQLLEYDHDYPYHLTQFPLQFHVKGEVIEYPMAWFTGYENLISGSGDKAVYTSLIEYVDRRVDVQIDGTWFSFQQTDETFWNEDISSISYGTADRIDRMNSANASMALSILMKDYPNFRDPAYHINSADLVVVATLSGQDYIFNQNGGRAYPTYYFQVDEILKGHYDSEEPLIFSATHGVGTPMLPDGTEYIPPHDDVMKGGVDNNYEYFKEGQQYLLFYEYNPYYGSYPDEELYRTLSTCSFTFWLAAIYEDTAYPVVNHVNHAFYEIPLTEIRDLCDDSFFEFADFTPDDVEKVTICHQGTSAQLSKQDQQRLLDSLADTFGKAISFEHEYPYQISDYQIQFHLADRVVEYPFAWFSGFQQEPSMVYVDRRVDVQIDGTWLSFEQFGESFWNDDISILSFYSSLPSGTDLSAFDCRTLADRYPGSALSMHWDPSYYIYRADSIVTADYKETTDSSSDNAMDQFEIQEVLKGDLNTDDLLQCFSFSNFNDTPDTFEPGTTHLLFLDYDHITKTYSYFEPHNRYSWLATIYNDTIYSCVNRESYAFFCMPMDRLRDLCEYYVRSTADLQEITSELPVYEPADATHFAAASIQACLMGADSENMIFSPTNLYTQLSLLAGFTAGDSRAQILNALASSDMNAIRSRQSSFYSTDLNRRFNSLWFNAYVSDSALWSLTQQHHASVYRGVFNSEIVSQTIYDWAVDRSRNDSLYLPDLTLSSEEKLLLAGTLYLDSAWDVPFPAEYCSEETFYSPSGEMQCDFMHQTTELEYYEGSQFTAVSKNLDNGGEVLFVLPNADSSIDLLLEEGEVLDLMVANLRGIQWDQQQTCTVNFSLPKFTITNATNLAEPLQKMGVTDIFDPELANFKPLSNDLSLSQLLHTERLMMNSDGCVREREEYDPMMVTDFVKGEGLDFVLDRPFLFVVNDPEGMPVYAGVVNQPEYAKVSTHILYDKSSAG